MKRIFAATVLASCGLAGVAAAQTVPSEPVSFGNGRVVIGGDAAVSISPEDDAYFNYSNYDHNTLREFRLGMTAQVRATERISVLGELRTENIDHISPYALYARIRPFPTRRLDVQIGRIPPTFGRFPRQAYSRDNPLIGYPLAYQYLTSLRADALPATADELLRMRGRGWRSSFTVGNTTPDHGVPLVNSLSWDTGVQGTMSWDRVTVTGAVTNGTESNPRVSDDNGGKQIATRVSVQPLPGLSIGSSFAKGEFVSRHAATAAQLGDTSFSQRADGLDIEYSRSHWVARADAVLSRWRLPMIGALRGGTPTLDPPSTVTPESYVAQLRALALSIEGRYTFLPGAYVAARAEHLGFNRITGSNGPQTWDANVRRFEIGGGYYLQRNVIARVSWQYNERDTARFNRGRFVAAQLLFWF